MKPAAQWQDTIQIKLVLLPIQDSTTSVFQMNCRNAELSSNLALRLSAVVARSWIFFCRVSMRWAIASPLWLPCQKNVKSTCFLWIYVTFSFHFQTDFLQQPGGQVRPANPSPCLALGHIQIHRIIWRNGVYLAPKHLSLNSLWPFKASQKIWLKTPVLQAVSLEFSDNILSMTVNASYFQN